jgi:F-type H+-transporting ATPase subunit a
MRNRILTILGVFAVVGLVLYLLGIKMTKADLHISAAAEPLFCLTGIAKGETCSGGIPFTNSLLMTILIDIILVVLAIVGVGKMKLVPTGLQNIIEVVVETFYNFALGIDRKNIAKFFPLPATIFCFFLIANLLALVPGVGSIGLCRTEAAQASLVSVTGTAAESLPPNPTFANWPGACYGESKLIPLFRAPAADLNVTLAFGLVAGFMIEFYGFQALGVGGYLGKFFVNPFKQGALQTLVGLLELIGEFTRIVAFTFRIFGNIFGGEVVLVVMAFLFPYLLPLPFYGLEVFVAFIQAVIFSVLTLIFFSLAITQHGGHDESHDEKVGAH